MHPRNPEIELAAPDCKSNVIPLERLRAACKLDEAWVSVDRNVYDLTGFMDQHPGGWEFIYLAAGKDVTQVFKSYHGQAQHQVLHKYQIGILSGQDVPSFPPEDEFSLTLKKRVDDYFRSSKIDRKYSPSGYVRYLLTTVAICCFYWLQWSTFSNTRLMFYVLSIVQGVALAQYSVCAFHDGSHGAAGHNPSMWRLLAMGHDLFNGSSSTLWAYQHVMSHHIFTNVEGYDSDIDTSDMEFYRIKQSQKYSAIYKYQPIYSPFLYFFLGISIRIGDLCNYYRGRRGPLKVNAFTVSQNMIFWGGKFFFHMTRIVLPLFWGNTPLKVIAAFLLTDFTFSIIVTMIFQATHLVNSVAFPQVNPKTGNIDMDWARLQVETAQDYSHDKPLMTFFSGSLNYQVVHHLFPSVAQEHLPAVAKIVRQTAQEFGVKYEIKDSLWAAIGGHIGLLKMFGTPPTGSH
ncbi:fatty acid desaturase-domain-containing protein [Lentinula guzmanii]|uniref:Delta 8-(E)-sphingolipid desaturase n=1 Tax=Lentinula guzmanii TaxID=2804957 RepID=A0AA38JAS7_9AGAR|nr:fatty acid desaturase-domain-containing protein [Lentinula guzmanii]